MQLQEPRRAHILHDSFNNPQETDLLREVWLILQTLCQTGENVLKFIASAHLQVHHAADLFMRMPGRSFDLRQLSQNFLRQNQPR